MRTRGATNTLILAVALLLAFGLVQPVGAALQAVGPVSVDNGFPIWYEDSNGLRLDLCLDQNGFCLTAEPNPALPISFPDNFGAEAFWWMAEAPAANAGIDGLLTLAMEAAFANENPVNGDQVAFARIRIRVNVPVDGAYTVTHPFGVITFPNVTAAAGINVTQDIGNFLTPGPGGDFTVALGDDAAQAGTVNADGRSIGPFLTRADGQLIVDQVTGNTYLSNPNAPTLVTGSPFNTNFFRIEGPGGIVAESSSFFLMGKVSGCTVDNLAPVAANDVAVTKTGAAVTFNVVDNDTDDAGVNPATLVITAQPANGTVAANQDGTVTYTPNAPFAGTDFFTYTVTDFCGLSSNTATGTVLVENLLANQADYRTRTGRWTLAGSSNFRDLSLATGPTETTYFTGLAGAQENPPVTSAASGEFMAIFDTATPAAFNYNLQVNVPTGITITQAHIHVGATGTNGPVTFFLCTNLGNAPAGTTVPPCTPVNGVIEVSGSLTATEFQAVGGLTTFDEAVAAIQAGGTYVNVHSATNPGGEIRGQIGRNVIGLRAGASGAVIGAAEVQDSADANKPWSFGGKSAASLGAAPHMIEAESALGVSATRALGLR